MLFRSSENLTLTWTLSGDVTITTTTAVTPNGTSPTTICVHEGGGNGWHYVAQVNGGSGVRTYSAWFRSVNRQWMMMSDDFSHLAYFDIVNGVVGNVTAGTTATIENWGNGWFRCIMTVATSAGGWFYINIAQSNGVFNPIVGVAQDSFLVWGVQNEDGPVVTSYILTGTAATARNLDSLRYKGDDGNLGGVGSNQYGKLSFSVLTKSHDTQSVETLVNLNKAGAAADRLDVSIGTAEGLVLSVAATGGYPGSTRTGGDISDG